MPLRTRLGALNRTIPFLALAAGLLFPACARPNAIEGGSAEAAAPSPPAAAEIDEATRDAVDRIRTATAPYKSLAEARAAGWNRGGARCVARPSEGAMGLHYENPSLLDDRIELERPEILVYERLPTGEYRLNGVEYIVPFSAVPSDAEPPTVMGQPLKRAPALGIWYRHVWVWLDNPSGLFADWNPRVTC